MVFNCSEKGVLITKIIVLLLFIAASYAISNSLSAQGKGDKTCYVRFDHGGKTSYGILKGNFIRELNRSPWSNGQLTGRSWNIDEVSFLIPVDPLEISKVVGVAVNTEREGLKLPTNAHPRWFSKFPTSLSTDGADILLPPSANNLNYEGELVIIISRKTWHVSQEEAMNYVFGYTVGNDFSENTWFIEEKDRLAPSRLISKGTDTWANLGSVIVSGIDYRGRRVVTKLNGKVVQDGNTDQIIQEVPELISHLSRYVTLLPGDVIFTGTVPFQKNIRRRMKPGDKLEVSIEGIGTVHSTIVPMDIPEWSR